MNSDRRTILSLIALGRITPHEAERLLALWHDEDEFMLRAAVCLAVAWMLLPHLSEFLYGAAHTLAALLPQLSITAHLVLTCAAAWLGGLS